MKSLFSIVCVFKLSICVVALSSLYSKIAVLTCSTVSLRYWRSFQNFNGQQNAKVWKSWMLVLRLFICKE